MYDIYNSAMPELPEVHTTATGLAGVLPGLKIVDVWTNYNSAFYAGKRNIKNPVFFKKFHAECIGKKILSVERRGKNILIHLEKEKTILIHMKMTGHMLYGTYTKSILGKTKEETWMVTEHGPLRDDPYNGWIHFVITLSNKKHLALSDVRKFAKITLFNTTTVVSEPDIQNLGPDPTHPNTTYAVFKNRLYTKSKEKIKTALMNQALLAGIGNIYSDEILWHSAVHPESQVECTPEPMFRSIYRCTKLILAQGIDFGGDSMSDYRNIHGGRGAFQHQHNAYRKTNHSCKKRSCGGIIERKIVGGRSAHFCPKHQKLFTTL